jgi:hypothetical protein
MQARRKPSSSKQALRLGLIALGAASLPLCYLIATQNSGYEHKGILTFFPLIPFFLFFLFCLIR